MVVHYARTGLQELLGPLYGLLDSALAAALVETLLFGTHLVLVCICVIILAPKRSRTGAIVLLWVVIMFWLATADVALTFHLVLRDVPALLQLKLDPNTLIKHILMKNPLFVTNNIIADGLLLHRCSMVWDGNRYVNLGCVALILVDTIWGYYSVETQKSMLLVVLVPLYLWSVFAINVIITAATAGRMWWIARQTRAILGKQYTRSYKIAVVILIESGALYALSIMLLVILWNQPCKLILYTIVYRMVGITPALMIVQVEVGGRVLKLNESSTRGPMFTSVAVDTISMGQQTEDPGPTSFENHPLSRM